MSNEKLTKKLAIFHHPLFQNTCLKWTECLGSNQISLNMLTFAEINIRIQKTIMADFNFENAFLSALNDWQQEVETLSSKEQSPQKKPVISKQKKEIELRTTFIKMLNELSFDAGLSDDAYMDLFSTSKHHDAFNFVKDHISLSGFFKFLFDLGYSFCEELDVELFCLLLNGVFLQATSIDMDQRLLQSVKSTTCLPNAFMTQHKLLKAHYNRYKKIDLSDYDRWYEWNYLPARINEMKAKAKEIFINCFPSDQTIMSFLDEIYDNSVAKIVQADLVMPTHKHFMPSDHKPGEISLESLFSLNPNMIERDTFIPVSHSPNHQASVHQKVVKKLTLPIFGKTIPKPSSEEKIRTHTIKSLSTFIDPTEEVSGPEPNQGLGPIWEDELSETTSTDTRANFYQPKLQDFGEDDSFSFAVKKKPESMSRYTAASVSVNFDQSKPTNQSDVVGDETYLGFMTGFNSYQVIRPQKDLSNLSGISKGQSLPEPITSRHRPLRALAKIEEIASNSYSQNMAQQKAFGVFGINPNGLVGLLDENRPASTNLTRRREVNRQIPYIAHSREPSSDQKRGILKGGSQYGHRKGGVEDLTLVGRSASQVVDAGSLSSLSTNQDYNPYESKETMLPAIDVSRQGNTSFKKTSYHPPSAEKQRNFNLYENVQFLGPEQILAKLKEKSSASAKVPPLRVEKPKLESSGYIWQVKENFDEKQREQFFEKMQQRQERNKRRQENRAKSAANNKKKNKREKSADVGARTKVFLNPQNRSLYKEVFM